MERLPSSVPPHCAGVGWQWGWVARGASAGGGGPRCRLPSHPQTADLRGCVGAAAWCAFPGVRSGGRAARRPHAWPTGGAPAGGHCHGHVHPGGGRGEWSRTLGFWGGVWHVGRGTHTHLPPTPPVHALVISILHEQGPFRCCTGAWGVPAPRAPQSHGKLSRPQPGLWTAPPPGQRGRRPPTRCRRRSSCTPRSRCIPTVPPRSGGRAHGLPGRATPSPRLGANGAVAGGGAPPPSAATLRGIAPSAPPPPLLLLLPSPLPALGMVEW